MYSSYSVAAAVCSVIFPVLAIVAVALRFRARSIKGQRYAADDYIVVLALVSKPGALINNDINMFDLGFCDSSLLPGPLWLFRS
jgi:hypothetical protein